MVPSSAPPAKGPSGRFVDPWPLPEPAPPLPWRAVTDALARAARGPHPHQLSPWRPEQPRRAAVAVVLWGDPSGARRLLLVQRGDGAPHHAGEIAFPGGMAEPGDRDLPATARRELGEELGLEGPLWELGCFPDGVAKARTRFTPVLFRWEAPTLRAAPGPEIQGWLAPSLAGLLEAPWTTQRLGHQGRSFDCPRLELGPAPLWGATALVLRAWLDHLAAALG